MFWSKLAALGTLFLLIICLVIFAQSSVKPSAQDSSTHNKKQQHLARQTNDRSGSTRPRKVKLLVAILTHAKRKPRRDGIRDTWLTICQKTDDCLCRFFTDEVGLEKYAQLALKKENFEHDDMVILPKTEPFAFSEKLLLIWKWASTQQLTYDFFLRIDDDHFLCLERLLQELDHRPQTGLYWGFLHCHPKVVRIDEAWLLLTADLVEEIMGRRQTKTLLCTPYGDQAVAIWINKSQKNVTYFVDNKRVIHKSAGKDPKYFRKDICEKYLSLHGTYPRQMRQFWLLSSNLRLRDSTPINYEVPGIEEYSKLCEFSPSFEYTGFIPEYQFKPKLCHEHPTWSVSGNVHSGREDDGERYSSY